MPAGRPSSYTEEVADAICARLSEGVALRTICKDADMPDRGTVIRWLTQHEDFAAKYARAREMQSDSLVDEMVDIEDATLTGDIKPDAARVVLGSKQWRAERMAPKRWGTKVENTIQGPNGGPIVIAGAPTDADL